VAALQSGIFTCMLGLHHCGVSDALTSRMDAVVTMISVRTRTQAVFDYLDVQHQASTYKPGSYNLVTQFPRKVDDEWVSWSKPITLQVERHSSNRQHHWRWP
jgi:hypothetical protein